MFFNDPKLALSDFKAGWYDLLSLDIRSMLLDDNDLAYEPVYNTGSEVSAMKSLLKRILS